MRQDLSLPLVVCEYEDVFSDELPGLPPHNRMTPIELQGTQGPNIQDLFGQVFSLDRVLHLGALQFCLTKKKDKTLSPVYRLPTVEHGYDQEIGIHYRGLMIYLIS